DALRAQGDSDAKIFSETRQVAYSFRLLHDVDYVFNEVIEGPAQASVAQMNAQVTCKQTTHDIAVPTPGQGQGQIQYGGGHHELELDKAEVNLATVQGPGECPSEVKASMLVQGNINHQFHYQLRYQDALGNQWTAPVAIANTDQPMPGHKFGKTFNQTFPIPYSGPGGGAAGGLGEIQANPVAGTGYAATPQGPGGSVNWVGFFRLDAWVGQQNVPLPSSDGGSETVTTFQSFVTSNWVKLEFACDPQRSGVATGAPGAVQVGAKVTGASLNVIPKPEQCGVQVEGEVQTDYNNVNVQLALENAAGDKTPWQIVRTEQTAHGYKAQISAFFDLSASGDGVWAAHTGTGANTWGLPGSANTPSYEKSGSFKLVTSAPSAFESNTESFNFLCILPVVMSLPKAEVNPAVAPVQNVTGAPPPQGATPRFGAKVMTRKLKTNEPSKTPVTPPVGRLTLPPEFKVPQPRVAGRIPEPKPAESPQAEVRRPAAPTRTNPAPTSPQRVAPEVERQAATHTAKRTPSESTPVERKAALSIRKLATVGRTGIDVWATNTGNAPASQCQAQATIVRAGSKVRKNADLGTVAPRETKQARIATTTPLALAKVSVQVVCENAASAKKNL
ncbi:MAG: hypothetical protein OEQ18_09380, partial [Gammaproteobacteria bacterium]|nr:hypothetical protein [Gammaproteobacteria bacterium]